MVSNVGFVVWYDCSGTSIPVGILAGHTLTMIAYLRNNYVAGIKTSPLRSLKFSIVATLIYGLIAAIVGLNSGLFKVHLIDSSFAWFLPFTLFVFPSFFEESLFRGILIPNNAKERGLKFVLSMAITSSTLFVAWHPLNALTINKGAQELFLNPYFLSVVFCLGMACSLSYIYSRSLWSPVIIHWLTVFLWVFFLGGRNLILG